MSAPPFSSTLGVGETLAVRDAGMLPLRQVMGAAYHRVAGLGVALQSAPGVTELEGPTRAWNDARAAAVARLREEAVAAGADAVVAVEVVRRVRGWAGGLVEVVVRGTAVRAPALAGGDAGPALCALSGQDVAKLVRHGHRPVGIVAGATIVSVTAGAEQLSRTRSPVTGRRSQELQDFSLGVSRARELAMARVTEQALALGAVGVVGVRIDRVERAHDTDERATSGLTAVLELHLLGTAIRGPEPGAREPDPRLLLSL